MPRKLLLLISALVMLAGACIPPEIEDDDTVPEFSLDTEMGLIQERGVLRVGIDTALGPLGHLDADGRPDGFAVGIADEIAGSLGVEMEIVSVEGGSHGDLILLEELDIALPPSPITERALNTHTFSDPYLVGHQRLAATREIATSADLAGVDVCQAVNNRTEVPADAINPDVGEVLDRDGVEKCVEPLRSGAVDAILAADVKLWALIATEEGLEITGEEYNVQGYGIMVRRDARGFNGFLDSVLSEMKSEGRWEGLYERWVTPVNGESPDPPTMTLEEATALYPAGGG